MPHSKSTRLERVNNSSSRSRMTEKCPQPPFDGFLVWKIIQPLNECPGSSRASKRVILGARKRISTRQIQWAWSRVHALMGEVRSTPRGNQRTPYKFRLISTNRWFHWIQEGPISGASTWNREKRTLLAQAPQLGTIWGHVPKTCQQTHMPNTEQDNPGKVT